MLQLSKDCPNLVCHAHISTAYTNSNVTGRNFVKEQIYDLPDGQDPEEVVKQLMALQPEEANKREKEIIGAYPNTYTFTKSLLEKTLKKNQAKLPVTIIRPSIIISCHRQPVRGWTDTISAGGALTFAHMIGLINFINTKPEGIYDAIPCDFVSNFTLAQIVYHATMRKEDVTVAHITSSQLNPLNIKRSSDLVGQYSKYHQSSKLVKKPSVTLISNPILYKLALNLTLHIPMNLMLYYSRLPYVGSAKQYQKIQLAKKVMGRIHQMD